MKHQYKVNDVYICGSNNNDSAFIVTEKTNKLGFKIRWIYPVTDHESSMSHANNDDKYIGNIDMHPLLKVIFNL